jgi:hypothetical protein
MSGSEKRISLMIKLRIVPTTKATKKERRGTPSDAQYRQMRVG